MMPTLSKADARRSGLRRMMLASALIALPAASGNANADVTPSFDPRAEIAAVQTLPPGSINELKAVPIGGIPQWISVRGTNPDNPILLFLHGGPGATMMPESWTFQRPWEDFFTVVQWDQRGAGKTYSAAKRQPAANLSLDLLADDTIELIGYLRKTYHKRKIILMGHSWGSALGLTVALRRPDLLYAYVGVGQVVNMERNEAEGYRLTLEEARRRNDKEAIKELTAIAPYPEKDGSLPITKTIVERKWDVALNGMIYALSTDDEEGRRRMSPAYSDYDLGSAALGEVYSATTLWPDAAKVNFDKVTSVPFPIVIFAGDHDRTTPTDVARGFLERVQAPYKRFILVPKAAHYVVDEAPGKVLLDLVNVVRPLAQDNSNASPGIK